jgi:hypothetical protein
MKFKLHPTNQHLFSPERAQTMSEFLKSCEILIKPLIAGTYGGRKKTQPG